MNPFLTNIQLALALVGYFIGSCILTPDLDSRKSKPSQLGGIIFKPYTILSTHRRLSHDTLIGTFLRIIYISLLVIVLIILYKAIFLNSINFNNFELILLLIKDYWKEILSAITGLFISNMLHIIIDALT